MTNTTNSVAKVTIVDKFNALIDYFNAEDKDNFEFEFDVTEFLEDRLEKSKKKSTGKADEKKAKENAEIRATILDVLENGRMRNSDIMKSVNSILNSDYSSNKISAQVTVLKNEGAVIRTVENKVIYFSIA